jgi:hypothetical protein
VRPQPGDVAEQPVVRRLAQGQVEPYLVVGDPQPLTERGHIRRQQGRLPGRPQRQPDVSGAHHLAAQLPERLADLATEHQRAHLLQHAQKRPGHAAHLLGQRAAHRSDHPRCHRLDQLGPRRQGQLDPPAAAPRLRGLHPGRHGRHGVQPEVGEAHRPADLRRVAVDDRGLARDRLDRALPGELPVDRPFRAGEQVADAAQRRPEVGTTEHGLERVFAARRGGPGVGHGPTVTVKMGPCSREVRSP